ncbi:hypothetical protein F2P79_000919 [Pimephales promelas]|nr:hypothetical protein F2P79_000919 [Pimephales promelas]
MLADRRQLSLSIKLRVFGSQVKSSGFHNANTNPSLSQAPISWPALFTEAQIKEEFRRITTYSLEETFTRKLDEYSRGLLRLMRAKGEVAGCKMCPLLDTLNDTQNIEKHEMLLSAASLKTRLPW